MRVLTNRILILFLCLYGMSVSANSNRWEGLKVPQFNLQDQNGKTMSNADLKGKWTVLYFYPKDKTPGCTIEAQNFTDDHPKYEKLGVQIVGVSYDDVASHKDFSDTYQMPFRLLADVDKKLGKAMKVDRILPLPHTARETFIVNPQGIIVKHYKKVSPKTHSAEILAEIAKLTMRAQAK